MSALISIGSPLSRLAGGAAIDHKEAVNHASQQIDKAALGFPHLRDTKEERVGERPVILLLSAIRYLFTPSKSQNGSCTGPQDHFDEHTAVCLHC
jgi:hypothetical protein